MFRDLSTADLDGGIQLIDVGASGSLDRKWRPIQQWINLTGFDPNADECQRLSEQRNRLKSANYLPYALAGEAREATMYKTKSIYCYSLLKPKQEWLRRFAFHDLFEVTGTESIQTHRLRDLVELCDVDVDAIKVDTQGLELPILSTAGPLLDRAFYVETETGFVQQYAEETTFSQIDEFMRNRGFLMFDMNTRHRIARHNIFQRLSTGREQILWCEAVWLRDYASQQNQQHLESMTRAKALKVLILCAIQHCLDFGYELAGHFAARGLLNEQELKMLAQPHHWSLRRASWTGNALSAIGTASRLLPRRFRHAVAVELERNLSQPSAVTALVRHVTGKRAA
jgi:FkbM family methyltransferase